MKYIKTIDKENNIVVRKNENINGYHLNYKGLFISFDSFDIRNNFFYAYNENYIVLFHIDLTNTNVYFQPRTNNNVYKLGD
jgi:hypothetical protein